MGIGADPLLAGEDPLRGDPQAQVGAQAAAPAGGGGGASSARARSSSTSSAVGRNGSAIARPAVERHGGDDLALELGDQHRAARARRAVELGEAHERGGVLRGGAAQHEVLARRGEVATGAASRAAR